MLKFHSLPKWEGEIGFAFFNEIRQRQFTIAEGVAKSLMALYARHGQMSNQFFTGGISRKVTGAAVEQVKGQSSLAAPVTLRDISLQFFSFRIYTEA
jgi:hypothetical protein